MMKLRSGLLILMSVLILGGSTNVFAEGGHGGTGVRKEGPSGPVRGGGNGVSKGGRDVRGAAGQGGNG